MEAQTPKKTVKKSARAAKDVVGFRISPLERAELEEEARLSKSTISDVARDRFRMQLGMKELHARLDRLEEGFLDIRKDYRDLVNEERMTEMLVETIRKLGPGFVREIMREGVREFYRMGKGDGSNGSKEPGPQG